MKKRFCFFPLMVLLPFFTSAYLSYSATIDQEVTKSYIASDYVTAANRLEQQIEEQKLRDSKAERVDYSSLYMNYLVLCHLYAWRLNKPDVALLKYQELNELRHSYKSASKLARLELLYIAEIYEVKNDYPKARENYENLLKELANFGEKENDDLSILISEDLIKFVKYQIDGLQLKAKTEKRDKPLLTKLKLSSQMTHQFFPFLAFGLAPAVGYILSSGKSIDLVDWIKQSPPDLSSMIQNYALILATSASTVDESSAKAMEAYLSKYPESYYSVQLRYLFYRFYKESEQTKKAEKLVKDLEKIAGKRGIELIIGPDKRFSSPEKTWGTFRNALIEGNIDVVADCYVPGQWKNRKTFALLGKEKMKEIGGKMGDIGKIIASEQEAKYRIRRIEEGKEITYYIYFYNFDGEWKMRDF